MRSTSGHSKVAFDVSWQQKEIERMQMSTILGFFLFFFFFNFVLFLFFEPALEVGAGAVAVAVSQG